MRAKRKLSFAARRNKPETETLREEKKKKKDKKKCFYSFCAQFPHGELSRFGKMFPREMGGGGGERFSPVLFSLYSLAEENARRDEAGEPRELHRRLYARGRKREK